MYSLEDQIQDRMEELVSFYSLLLLPSFVLFHFFFPCYFQIFGKLLFDHLNFHYLCFQMGVMVVFHSKFHKIKSGAYLLCPQKNIFLQIFQNLKGFEPSHFLMRTFFVCHPNSICHCGATNTLTFLKQNIQSPGP